MGRGHKYLYSSDIPLHRKNTLPGLREWIIIVGVYLGRHRWIVVFSLPVRQGLAVNPFVVQLDPHSKYLLLLLLLL